MAENHFITRYCIAIENSEAKAIFGLDELCNLFDKTILDFFYNFFKDYLIKEIELIEIAQKEKENQKKKFFKVINIEKENNMICGQIIFSDFEEILTSLVAEDMEKNDKTTKFIPQRRFFFMLKIKKIRAVNDKEMNIGILLLHKRGNHSIKQIISDLLSKKFRSQGKDLFFKAIEFNDEMKELENSEVKTVTVLERKILTDLPEEDEMLKLGIKEVKRKNFLKITPGKRNLQALKSYVFSDKSNFSLNSEEKVMEVTLKTEKGDKIVTYTNENGLQRVTSVLLAFNDICIENKKEIDWDKIKSKFLEEMEECDNKVDIRGWWN